MKHKKTKLLTFQSNDVLNILLENGVYRSDTNKSRERRDYSLDIAQLNGNNPIWCFYPLNDLHTFKSEDFLDGVLFQRYRCEMSIRYSEEISKLMLLEIVVPTDSILLGLTHNAYRGAVVIPIISKENLIAVYRLIYEDGHPIQWYYPEVKVLQKFREDTLFKEDFFCKKTNSN